MLDGMRQAFVRLGEQYVQLDQVAQNQANTFTPGFRSGDSGTRQGQFAQWMRNEQGSRLQTGKDTDISLAPDAYLQVKTGNGVSYTRRGDLSLDSQHRLVTGAGDPVLDASGSPITLPAGAFHVLSDGTILSGKQKMATLGRFKIGAVQETQGTLFTPQDSTSTPVADNRPVAIGELENSNVDGTVEQTRLIALNNRAHIFSQVIQTQDSTLEKALQQLGKSR